MSISNKIAEMVYDHQLNNYGKMPSGIILRPETVRMLIDEVYRDQPLDPKNLRFMGIRCYESFSLEKDEIKVL